jgi:ribosome-binding protein aMBF1 (putative translation factor)
MENERLKKLKEKLLKDPKFKKVYEGHDPAFEIGEKIFEARVSRGWSQEKLAQKSGIKRLDIARIESGVSIDSTATFKKLLASCENLLTILHGNKYRKLP